MLKRSNQSSKKFELETPFERIATHYVEENSKTELESLCLPHCYLPIKYFNWTRFYLQFLYSVNICHASTQFVQGLYLCNKFFSGRLGFYGRIFSI